VVGTSVPTAASASAAWVELAAPAADGVAIVPVAIVPVAFQAAAEPVAANTLTVAYSGDFAPVLAQNRTPSFRSRGLETGKSVFERVKSTSLITPENPFLKHYQDRAVTA